MKTETLDTLPSPPAEATADAEPTGQGSGLVAALRAKAETARGYMSSERGMYLTCADIAAPIEAAWQARLQAAESRLRAERHATLNLLARIFRDGGHRALEIGIVTSACEEAEVVVVSLLQKADAAAERVKVLTDGVERIRQRACVFSQTRLRGENPNKSGTAACTWIEGECRALLRPEPPAAESSTWRELAEAIKADPNLRVLSATAEPPTASDAGDGGGDGESRAGEEVGA